MRITISKREKRVGLAMAGVGLLAATMAGCGDKLTEPFQDAPRAATVNDSPAQVVTMPDGFSNVASKCDGPNRIYVIFHLDSAYGALSVVPNDPRCKG